MRKRFISILAAVLFVASLASCSAGKASSVQSLQKDGGFIYSEEVPWGTSFEDAKVIYADEKIDPESSEFESWRIAELVRFDQQVLIPDIQADFYGLSWMVELEFDETGLCLVTFSTHIDEESFPQTTEKIVDDLYQQFGEGSMPKEELKGLLADCKGQIVQMYWKAEDGSYLHLHITSQADSSSYSFSIAVAPNEKLTPVSGSKEAPDYDKIRSSLQGVVTP